MKKSVDEKNAKVIVGAFIFNEKNELLLISVKKWGDKYVCPGGHVNFNESLHDAVIREIKEETGITIKDVEFVSVKEGIKLGDKYSGNESHHVYINFSAKVSDVKKIKLNEEATEYKWLSIDEWKKRDDLSLNIYEVLEELSVDSMEGRYKRAIADYQNLLKQSARDKQEFAKYANESLLHDLIPVYDNLKTSMKHLDEETMKTSWAVGIGYIIKQFADALKNSGVEEVETVGKDFDHNTMEAMSGKGDKVAKELRPGYKLNGKVIIPAKVELE